tara:strand:- start:336 stop:503 length:168 start_codon:yes stop_codon:yes gene_type:complete
MGFLENLNGPSLNICVEIDLGCNFSSFSLKILTDLRNRKIAPIAKKIPMNFMIIE